jgi:catechol 2,3-dioxygenase-like lactoylglutathione lyase family enzyme
MERKLLTEDDTTGSMPRVDDCPAAALGMEEGIMAITLNHTIVPAKDKQASAQFFAHIFGLQVKEGEGRFAQVQVNDTLTMDFDQLRPVVESIHYAFHVSDAEFDGIYERVKAAGIAYGSGPFDHKNMQINSARRGGRAFYFEDIDGHLLEVMTA